MTLANLSLLLTSIQKETSELPFHDACLSDNFKEKYARYVIEKKPGGYKKIVWAEHSAHITTTTERSIYLPNYWFVLASHISKFYGHLEQHKKTFIKIFPPQKNNLEEIAKSLKNQSTINSEHEKSINDYFRDNDLTNQELENFNQFVCKYNEWGGGKTIDRNDYYVSPLLKSANLLAEAQTAIAELSQQIAQEPELRDALDFTLQSPQEHIITKSKTTHSEKSTNTNSPLPKPFLLLAGISGTGKTRFVRQQAERSAVEGIKNFELIAVRPDWHDPSDLLGYVSRISGTQFITTPFLQFMAAAWRDAVVPGAGYSLKNPAEMTPFWACLDEMNLAPVEQYFADYLSVLETRKWHDGNYSSEPIFAPSKLFKSTDTTVFTQLRINLGFSGEYWDGLWDYFLDQGMPLPPNLIVAGTVNMDETTHGFSRKVIDRAFTIDFGEFFPNDYQHYFEPKRQPVTLGFPLDSRIASAEELKDVAADPDGSQSIAFLQRINDVFKATPFELAFRALNELLVMLKCFSPQTDAQLYAVWDDFLMAKLLPRLEGDEDKLQVNGDDSLLIQLKTRLATEFASTTARPDLFNTQLADGTSPDIPFRSLKKLGWMQDRLVRDRFTSFWP